jgi:purine nucleosidase
VPRKIIVDCDPGHDAIALLIAHGSPEIELLAITTVMGGTTLSDVSQNALAVAALGDIRDVPIADRRGLRRAADRACRTTRRGARGDHGCGVRIRHAAAFPASGP